MVNADMNEGQAEVLADIAKQPAAEGWKLVPVEPTTEMCEALEGVLCDEGWEPDAVGELPKHQCWDAMLAAAPSPHSSVNEMELVDHLVKALEYYTDAVCEGETCGGGYYATEFDGQTARDALALVAAHRARKGEQG